MKGRTACPGDQGIVALSTSEFNRDPTGRRGVQRVIPCPAVEDHRAHPGIGSRPTARRRVPEGDFKSSTVSDKHKGFRPISDLEREPKTNSSRIERISIWRATTRMQRKSASALGAQVEKFGLRRAVGPIEQIEAKHVSCPRVAPVIAAAEWPVGKKEDLRIEPGLSIDEIQQAAKSI